MIFDPMQKEFLCFKIQNTVNTFLRRVDQFHTNINRNTQFIKSRKFLKFSPYVWLTRDVDHILILIQVLIRVKISDLI